MTSAVKELTSTTVVDLESQPTFHDQVIEQSVVNSGTPTLTGNAIPEDVSVI